MPPVWARVDLTGAALLIADRRVVAVTEASIAIETLSGSQPQVSPDRPGASGVTGTGKTDIFERKAMRNDVSSLESEIRAGAVSALRRRPPARRRRRAPGSQ